MIPIRDINPRMRLPWVNYALLAGIAVVFGLQLTQLLDGALSTHGFVPAKAAQAWTGQTPWLPVVAAALTSLFLHGGWIHVIGNLIYLRVFGDNLEERLGHIGYLLIYVVFGIIGFAAQTLADPSSQVPVVGASGAIAGVIGAYIVIFPSSRVVTLFPVFVFLTFIEVPAVVFVGVWAAQQLLNGYLALSDGAVAEVAWFAHLGGFAAGVAVGVIYQMTAGRRRRARRKYQMEHGTIPPTQPLPKDYS